MPDLTKSDLTVLKDRLSAESLLIIKYKEAAINTDDAILRGMFEQIAAQHKNHYNTLLDTLNAQ